MDYCEDCDILQKELDRIADDLRLAEEEIKELRDEIYWLKR